MSESTYRWFSAIAGAVAGAVCVVGFVGLVYRRATNVARAPHDLAHRPARLLPARRADRPRLLDDVRAQPDHQRRPYDYRDSVSEWWRSLFILQPDVEAVAGRQHRLPGARDRRLGVLGAVPVQPARARLEHPAAVPRPPVHPLPAPLRRRRPTARDERPPRTSTAGTSSRSPRVAFTACFYAWSLLGPLGPDLQDALGLSDFQTSAMVAVPVLLGSLMRIPLGWLTDRLGGRRVFTALMAFTPLPLIALALLHDSLGADPRRSGSCSASPARRSPSACRSSTAGTRPSARASRWASTAMGMGGTVLAGLTAPRIADRVGPLRAVLGGRPPSMVVDVRRLLRCSRATRRDRRGRGPAPGMFAALSVFRTSGRAWALTLFYFLAFGGFVAMFLYLPKLLTGVHDLTKADAGARAAGFALLAVIGRPTRRLALRPHRRRRASCSSRSSPSPCSPLVLAAAYTVDGAAHDLPA